ncbi:MAG: hypothetical protein G01um101425_208 [Candidatus Peregrinibacteria bacterium Gr01-1014_25]|nr:MAG: hypothetical protein G01um101425_208 [Candidatus Peregrinibacteria bacterium Gr01-1014_25]
MTVNKPIYPTQKEYSAHPRARELREITLQIIRSARMILTEKEGLNPEARQRIYGALEHAQGRLIALGITPKLHVGTFTDADRRTPVKVAEYVAGQIMGVCGRVLHSESEAMHQAEEHDSIGQAGLLALDQVPRQTKDWMNDMTIVNACIRFLDADHEWSQWIANHRDDDARGQENDG